MCVCVCVCMCECVCVCVCECVFVFVCRGVGVEGVVGGRERKKTERYKSWLAYIAWATICIMVSHTRVS